MDALWHITLLGGFSAVRADRTLHRFQSHKTGSILAHLAFHGTSVSRDVLIDQVWPEVDLDHGRHNLRQSLSTLRKQLEPLGVAYGSVLFADHATVRLKPDAITTDVAQFRAAIQTARNLQERTNRIAALQTAEALYGGDLLPGLFDDWVISARESFSATYLRLLRSLCRLVEEEGDLELALQYSLQASQVALGEESVHQEVLRLYMKLGRNAEAARHYRHLLNIRKREHEPPPGRAIVQLVAPALSAIPPAENDSILVRALHLASPQDRQGSEAPLPTRLTRFFGRGVEIESVSRRLDPCGIHRLVTLIGPPGCGKTRLAIQIGKGLEPVFDAAVGYVAAEHIVDAEALLSAVAATFRLPSHSVDARAQILAELRDRTYLLILDNCEQFEEAAAKVVAELLEELPHLRCLATSRRSLGIEGESLLPVPPLPVPDGPGVPYELMTYPSVAIFVDRAQTVNPDFQITARNAEAVATICRRLEGYPLALELAAARAQTLTPAQINLQLDRQLDLLVSRRRTTESRHRTLRTAIDWSYRLLSSARQRFFTRLSAFRGTFSLAAVHAICDEEDSDPTAALEDLIAQSLVAAAEDGDEIRFHVPESLRVFGTEQLDPCWEDSLRERYVGYFVHLAQDAADCLRTPARSAWLARLDRDAANLRHALEIVEGTASCAELTAALWRYWVARGQFMEGLRRLRSALAVVVPTGDAVQAELLLGLGVLCERTGRLQVAGETLHASLTQFDQIGNRAGSAQALNMLTVLAERRADYASGVLLAERAIELWRDLDDLNGMAASLNNAARLRVCQDALEIGESLYREALAHYQDLSDWANAAIVLSNLGALLYRRGRLSQALASHSESLDLFRALGNPAWTAAALHNVGDTMCHLDDGAGAVPYLTEALSIVIELNDRVSVGSSLVSLASAARRMGEPQRAVRLLGAAERLRAEIGTVLTATANNQIGTEIELLRSSMSSNAFETEWSRGQLMNYDRAVRYALGKERTSDDPLSPLEGELSGPDTAMGTRPQ